MSFLYILAGICFLIAVNLWVTRPKEEIQEPEPRRVWKVKDLPQGGLMIREVWE